MGLRFLMNEFQENMADTPERTGSERHLEAVREQGGTGYAELPAGTDPDLPRLSRPFRQQDLARAIATRLKGDGEVVPFRPRQGSPGNAHRRVLGTESVRLWSVIAEAQPLHRTSLSWGSHLNSRRFVSARRGGRLHVRRGLICRKALGERYDCLDV